MTLMGKHPNQAQIHQERPRKRKNMTEKFCETILQTPEGAKMKCIENGTRKKKKKKRRSKGWELEVKRKDRVSYAWQDSACGDFGSIQ